nr:VOC family protein [Leptolyngbya sp. FACHB-321]
MHPRLNLVTLGVHDLSRSLQFYRDGLGWKPSSASQAEIAFFQLGGLVLALYPRTKLAEDITIDAVGTGFPGITLAYNGKSRAEVDEVLQLVKQLGARVVKPAQDVFGAAIAVILLIQMGTFGKLPGTPFSSSMRLISSFCLDTRELFLAWVCSKDRGSGTLQSVQAFERAVH